MPLMDWATAVGLVMSALATADLAYKYGSRLVKKIHRFSRGKRQLTHQTDTFSKKVSGATTSPLKKISEAWSRPRSTQQRPPYFQGSYAKATKIRPSFDLDILTYYGPADLKKT
jgi:hypothetical protein